MVFIYRKRYTMKLKKLLPIASVASVAAVVAPIVTSCGSATFSYKFDENNWASDFIPDNQIPASEHKLVWADEATYEYLSAVKKNKQILADDIVFSTIMYYFPLEDVFAEGTCEAKIGNIDPKTKKCSFSLEFNLAPANVTSNSAGGVTKVIAGKIEVKNLEFDLVPGQYMWTMIPYVISPRRLIEPKQVPTYLKTKKDWSVDITEHRSFRDFETNIKLHYDWQNSTTELESALLGTDRSGYLYEFFTFSYMYYFENVTIREVK